MFSYLQVMFTITLNCYGTKACIIYLTASYNRCDQASFTLTLQSIFVQDFGVTTSAEDVRRLWSEYLRDILPPCPWTAFWSVFTFLYRGNLNNRLVRYLDIEHMSGITIRDSLSEVDSKIK